MAMGDAVNRSKVNAALLEAITVFLGAAFLLAPLIPDDSYISLETQVLIQDKEIGYRDAPSTTETRKGAQDAQRYRLEAFQ